jgi:hypothetical protein
MSRSYRGTKNHLADSCSSWRTFAQATQASSQPGWLIRQDLQQMQEGDLVVRKDYPRLITVA